MRVGVILGRFELVELGSRARDSGIVDEDVDASLAVADLFCDPRDVFLFRDVSRTSDDLAWDVLSVFFDDGSEVLGSSPRDVDARSVRRKRLSRHKSDSGSTCARSRCDQLSDLWMHTQVGSIRGPSHRKVEVHSGAKSGALSSPPVTTATSPLTLKSFEASR